MKSHIASRVSVAAAAVAALLLTGGTAASAQPLDRAPTTSTGTVLAAAGETSTEPRKTVATVLSWLTPIGAVTGKRDWWRGPENGYLYAGYKSGNGVRNYPVPTVDVDLPSVAPAVGSDEFHAALYDALVESELPAIKAAGIDVVLFDMQADPSWDPAQPLTGRNAPFTHYKSFLTWVEAAEVVGGVEVGLFLEPTGTNADYPESYVLSVAEWVKLMKGALDNLPDSEAVWHVDGKPAITMFGNHTKLKDIGETPYFGWEDVVEELRTTNDFYLVPDINPTLVDYGKWSTIADAGYTFTPSAPTGWLTGTGSTDQVGMATTAATQTTYPQMPWYFVTSPGYYQPNLRAYTQPDFERIHKSYTTAIAEEAVGMHVLTWNDVSEDTDIWPSDNKGTALLDVYAYYNDWFKSGTQPAAVEDNITVSYPLFVHDVINTPPVNWGPTKASPPFLLQSNPSKGNAFYWANLSTAQTLTFNGVSVSLPAGLSYGAIPGGVAPGTVTVSVDTGAQVSTEQLPAVEHLPVESNNVDGGLQFRYERLTIPPTPTTPVWDAGSTYGNGDRVTHDGREWVAQWWTSNQQPGDPTGPWAEVGAQVASSEGPQPSWTPSGIYDSGAVVAHDGELWRAKWWTRNQEPSSSPHGPWEHLGAI